jgi:hypothetical protein
MAQMAIASFNSYTLRKVAQARTPETSWEKLKYTATFSHEWANGSKVTKKPWFLVQG